MPIDPENLASLYWFLVIFNGNGGRVLKLKRGELRILSASLIEQNSSKSFDEIVQLHIEAFEFDMPTARTHIRWMIREGLVIDGENISKNWPRRARKSKEVSTKKTSPVIPTPDDILTVLSSMNVSMHNLLVFKRPKAA